MTSKTVTRRAMIVGASACILLPRTSFGQSIEAPVEGGIGGTGIVGLLTEFGSLIVAGNYVQTDKTTRFTDGFGAIREADLRLGNSLTVEAQGGPDQLVARRVHVTHPLVGRVEQLTQGGRLLRINGVDVVLARGVPTVRVGAFVKVSGVWRGQSVIGSAVEIVKPTQHLVSGDVSRASGFNVMQVGGTKVRGAGVGSLQPGGFATAVGQYDPLTGMLNVTKVTSGRFFGAAGPLVQLSVEGYLEPTRAAPGYRIAGLGHSFQRNLKLDAYKGKRMLFNGGYTGKFAAQSAVILPERKASRVRLLGAMSRVDR